MTRRAALGSGVIAAAGLTVPAVLAAPDAAAADPDGPGLASLGGVYRRQKARAGGNWHSYVSAITAAGTFAPVLQDAPDTVTHGYSVQKLAVATAVMDKVDRGLLQLGQRVDLTADIILEGSGIYFHQTVYGDSLTLANVLTALLLVSDNTAVRLCGLVAPALEINSILEAKGFVHTRVEPVANPNRFFLGVTTPREMTDLLTRLANKTLLSAPSCNFLLGILRGLSGYQDGIRRVMSSTERSRVATKYGADFDETGASRHEVGIMYDANGGPVLVYGFFADQLGDIDNYGGTHPAVEAHAVLGRTLFDRSQSLTNSAAPVRHLVPPFKAVDGG